MESVAKSQTKSSFRPPCCPLFTPVDPDGGRAVSPPSERGQGALLRRRDPMCGKLQAATCPAPYFLTRLAAAEARVEELASRVRKLELQALVERHHPRGGAR